MSGMTVPDYGTGGGAVTTERIVDRPNLPNSQRVPLRRRMHHYFEATAQRTPDAVALIADGVQYSYADLDSRANRLARALMRRGVAAQSRLGLFVPRSFEMYLVLLAALKTGSTIVPIDPASPPERVGYVCEDAQVEGVVTLAALTARLGDPDYAWSIETLIAESAALEPTAPVVDVSETDPVAYILYTSGSSGRPKGVAVAHSSITSFIHVVSGLYNVSPRDRVYQGMSLSFDFSVEEIWPTWSIGATLVAGPPEGRHLGADLAVFLQEHEVTVIYCVPTVLSTIDRDLPLVHTLNVGGEACPQHLVERWGENRLILNTYGPTEATVTCIYTALEPGRPVTIGFPLPTYEVHLLDDGLTPVPDGEVGEICVGGIGVALGYIGRPDLTAEKFVANPFGEGRLYRTGDLGRMTTYGIEYLGRADESEVKVRGKRVDLGEIEAQLRECAPVRDAVVTLTDASEIAAYVTVVEGTDEAVLRDEASTRTRANLLAHMVPSTLRVLDELPMMTSGKVSRRDLPDPGARLVVHRDVLAPRTPVEERIARMWAESLGLDPEDVSVTADFFADLSGHSMAAALAVSMCRGEYPAAGLSVADLYAHPTVEASARLVEERVATTATPGQGRERSRHNPVRRWAVGFAQLGLIYALVGILGLPVGVAYTDYDGRLSSELMWMLLTWIPLAYLAVRWILPVVAIRLASIGMKPGTYPMWGWMQLRVWMIHRLLEMSPATQFAGSPALAGYLRLLGADVGRDVHIASATVGIPAMLRIADGASIGYGVHLQHSSVQDGRLRLGTVFIGERAFVGSSAHLGLDSSVGRDAVLTEHSVLGEGHRVPDGQVHGGSPARPGAEISLGLASIKLAPLAPRSIGTWDFRGRLLAGLLALEAIPFLILMPAVAMVWWVMLNVGVGAGLIAALAAGPVYLVSCCVVLALARAVVVDTTPPGVFPLRSRIGLQRWWVDKIFEFSLVLTNSLFATLYTPTWLRMLGATVGARSEVSTLAHVDPELLDIGEEGFVADMAHVGSAVVHDGKVSMARTRVEGRAFVGNASFIPAGSTLGRDSLVGVHTVPPASGVPEGTSWLGAPAIFLPQRQQSAVFDDHLTFHPTRAQVRERLVFEFFRATAPASILGAMVYVALLVISWISHGEPYSVVLPITPFLLLLGSVFTVTVSVVVKWILMGAYRPRVEPLWSRFVRRSELVTGIYEAAAVPVLLHMLAGTPFLGPVMRLYGCKVGRRVYLDSTYITEFDLVELGDDVSIGSGVSLQTHLFEDRVMKMSTVRIQQGADIGDRTVVLYDTVVQEGVQLGPLSLVMKGETLPANTSWLGIPARQM